MTTHRSTILIAAGALVLASSGGAVAGGLITGKDIKNGSVTGKDIKNKSVKTNDLSPKTVAQLKGGTGPAGAVGPQGDPGATGAAGAPGTTSVTVRMAALSAAAGASGYAFAACEPGEVATGGGFYWDSPPSPDMYSQDGAPANATGFILTSPGPAVSWGVEAYNGTGAVKTGKVHVLCAATGAAPAAPRGGESSAPSADGRG